MIKCKVNNLLEITITADINHLPLDEKHELLSETTKLAKLFAEKFGYNFVAADFWTEKDLVKEIKCNYKEFFEILQSALQSGDEVQRADKPHRLICGFTVGGNRYLMGLPKLKHAKENGVDISIYNNLK